MDFEKHEYLAQHIILSTTSTHLGVAIKDLQTAKEMWNAVKADVTTKSTLYLIDTEDQLASMHLNDSNDPHAHFTDLKQHFKLMTRRHDNLVKMGSTISDTQFTTMIMSSLLPSYCSPIQTITAAWKVGATQGTLTKQKLPPSELIAFFTEEAQHCVIDDEHTKAAESALLVHRRKEKKHSRQQWSKTKSDKCCENCGKNGHSKVDCGLKGGGKEGQGQQKQTQRKVLKQENLP